MIDLDKVCRAIEAAAGYYEKSAPPVEQWLDDLYRRIHGQPDEVRLSELLAVERLLENGQWMQPNYAANAIYKLQHRLGRDTTGLAGF